MAQSSLVTRVMLAALVAKAPPQGRFGGAFSFRFRAQDDEENVQVAHLAEFEVCGNALVTAQSPSLAPASSCVRTFEDAESEQLPGGFGAADKKIGKPQTGWMTEVKITSNKRIYEANLLANGPEYAVVAYADLQRGGITGSVQTVIYQIDLATLKIKRTITFFPAGKDAVAEGVCKKL